MQFDNLVCIYTCERHKGLLRAFYRSIPGRYLINLPSTAILEIYADPDVPASFQDGDRIVLRTPERYDALSLKTFEMIRYCVENFEFQRLIKIDVTVVRRRLEGKEFTGRKPLDLEKLESFLAALPVDCDYDGFIRHDRTGHGQALAWAAKKGGSINYERIFGSDPMPPFYNGACYCIGRAFAEFIATRGAAMAQEHATYLMGAEDVMIGRLFQMFAELSKSPRRETAHDDSSEGAKPASEAETPQPHWSALFNTDWYLAKNPDVREAGVNPLEHYVRFGAAEGRDPNPLFDTDWYLARYPDIRQSGVNPLEHYVRFGAREGRDPNPLFDTDWYLARYPDVRQSGLSPLEHYLRLGAADARDPNPLFDAAWYLAHNPDAQRTDATPLEHFLQNGSLQGSSPHPLFDPDWYLEQNPDVRALGAKPLEHFLQFGAAEGRDPHTLFDVDFYLIQNPDVADHGWNAVDHFMRHGGAEGRIPHRYFATGWYLRTYPRDLRTYDNALVDYIHDGARQGRHPNPLFAEAAWRYDEGGKWFDGLHKVVSRADIEDFVGSVVGRAHLSKEWGALFRAYVEGDRNTLLSLVERILTTTTLPNVLYSEARASLYRLKAECLLAEDRTFDALEAAKQGVMLSPESEISLTALRQCLLARDLAPAPKPNLIVLLISCEKYQERALATYRTLVDMGLFVKVVVGAGAKIHVDLDCLHVAAGDFYEDLPFKVRDAINWVYETYGATANVLKVDDDLLISDLLAFRRFISNVSQGRSHYVGQAAGAPQRGGHPVAVWRDFHYGKCHDDAHNKPYGKRTGGRYAVGLIYYLSGTAVETFYEFVHRYPDEIMGEMFEDLFVGKVMEASGVKLKDVRCAEMGLPLDSLIW